jgi:hypothetical protein
MQCNAMQCNATIVLLDQPSMAGYFGNSLTRVPWSSCRTLTLCGISFKLLHNVVIDYPGLLSATLATLRNWVAWKKHAACFFGSNHE